MRLTATRLLRQASRWLALAAALGLPASAIASDSADGAPRGVNPRDLVSKLDLIFKRDVFDGGVAVNSWTLKYDRALGTRWGVAAELPFAQSRTPWGITSGLSESKLKFRRVTTEGRFSWLLGGEFVLPTAEHAALGSGTWQVNPSAGVVYAVSPQVFAFGGVQRFQSISEEAGRLPVRQNQARLLVARVSPKGWWVMGDLKATRDLVADADLLDVEVEAGRMVTASTAFSVRLAGSGMDSPRSSGVVVNYRILF